jgi:hypothetical protein
MVGSAVGSYSMGVRAPVNFQEEDGNIEDVSFQRIRVFERHQSSYTVIKQPSSSQAIDFLYTVSDIPLQPWLWTQKESTSFGCSKQ